MRNEYWLLSDLSLSDGANPLTWSPHPTEFQAFSEVKTTGDGDGVGLGFFRFKWTSGKGILTPTQWNYLMGFFSGWEPSVGVYARTRTDRAVAVALAEYGHEFEYLWLSVNMWRPKAVPHPGFRYKDVEILFTGGELV